ncbi:MAG: hypothetical protein JWN73_1658 [Betaproteobacteria bacterium]|nr:hypothetical protein [Betaproteobacteria bacterium]
MSPTKIYDEYAIEFFPENPEDHDWIYVHDGKAADIKAISGLLSGYIPDQEVIVLIHSDPGIGAMLPRDQAAAFIGQHIDDDIQVSNSAFTCFVAVSKVGVATGWAA